MHSFSLTKSNVRPSWAERTFNGHPVYSTVLAACTSMQILADSSEESRRSLQVLGKKENPNKIQTNSISNTLSKRSVCLPKFSKNRPTLFVQWKMPMKNDRKPATGCVCLHFVSCSAALSGETFSVGNSNEEILT